MALTLLLACISDGPVVFAAASTAAAVEEALADYPEKVVVSAASSSVLARQIQAGAPAVAFLSAHREWVDGLELVSREDGFLGNSVVVAGAGMTIEDAAKARCVAVGDPDTVPSGRYAREALRTTGDWQRLTVVPTLDAVAASAIVARGECEVGLLYQTDAIAAGLRSGDVIYSAAAYTLVELPGGSEIVAHLRSKKAVFVRHGFRAGP
jgi:molybdate transport system substrate-binding protein